MKWINSLPTERQIEARANALSALPLEEATQELNSLKGKAKETAISAIADALVQKSGEQAH